MSLPQRFLEWLDKRGSGRLITRQGVPYLQRYYLFRSKYFGIMLHQFWSSDPDDPHSHPWANVSMVLRGGYHEHFLDGSHFIRNPLSFVLRSAGEFHRIEVPEGSEGSAWSLFFRFKRTRSWGFLTKNGWVDARDYDDKVDTYGKDYEIKGMFFPKVITK